MRRAVPGRRSWLAPALLAACPTPLAAGCGGDDSPNLRRSLETLADVGLGYIALGLSSPTLSGGEAHGVKLSRELSKRSTGRTLYILDACSAGSGLFDREGLDGPRHHLTSAESAC